MPASFLRNQPLMHLRALDKKTGDFNVVIDTPRGSREKFKFDEKLGLFKLSKVLPAGAVFPFDFGYIPGTQGEDGDPLDVLVLLDEAVFVGCLLVARLIGVIEAEQTEDGETIRNDRLIAVAVASNDYRDIQSLGQVNVNLLDEIEHFFVSYNEAEGKKFEPLGRLGPKQAQKLVKQGMKQFKQSSAKATPGRKSKRR